MEKKCCVNGQAGRNLELASTTASGEDLVLRRATKEMSRRGEDNRWINAQHIFSSMLNINPPNERNIPHQMSHHRAMFPSEI
jgi:hypothetical protein